jgi:hypothetical protein
MSRRCPRKSVDYHIMNGTYRPCAFLTQPLPRGQRDHVRSALLDAVERVRELLQRRRDLRTIPRLVVDARDLGWNFDVVQLPSMESGITPSSPIIVADVLRRSWRCQFSVSVTSSRAPSR